LLLLSIRKGEDKFNIALGVDVEEVNIGTIIKILSSLIDFIKEFISNKDKSGNKLNFHFEFILIFILSGMSLK
jgi:hypothetical protein